MREPGTYHSIEIHSRSANPFIVFIVIDEENDRFMIVSKDTSTGIATAAAVAAVPSCIIHRATPLHQQANHHLVRSSANQLYFFLYFMYFFISKILLILLMRIAVKIGRIFRKVPKGEGGIFLCRRVTSGFRVCFCNNCIEKNQNKVHFEEDSSSHTSLRDGSSYQIG